MKDKHKTRSEIIDGIDENTKYIPVIKDMICPNMCMLPLFEDGYDWGCGITGSSCYESKDVCVLFSFKEIKDALNGELK